MPAMAVEIVTLEAKPIEQTTEFVGTVKSRRSTDIQPQVEGFITRITAKPGQRVGAGALLMEIDSRVQQGQLASLESVRAQREIDVTYARQEAERASKLLKAGAGSQMEADRAANDLKAAEAQLRTVQEQIRTARTDLGYYRVTAPTAGIVGDIPVREGDRVTKATKLTSIDANAGLEVYINVPVQQAPKLQVGLPVRIVDDSRRDDRRREDRLRFAVGRRADADRARQDAGVGARHVAHGSVRALVRDLDDRARPDGAGDGGDAHQRPVVRVRRGAGRRRQGTGREAALARAGTGRRQQLHGRERA